MSSLTQKPGIKVRAIEGVAENQKSESASGYSRYGWDVLIAVTKKPRQQS
jgi:hypothetical protein